MREVSASSLQIGQTRCWYGRGIGCRRTASSIEGGSELDESPVTESRSPYPAGRRHPARRQHQRQRRFADAGRPGPPRTTPSPASSTWWRRPRPAAPRPPGSSNDSASSTLRPWSLVAVLRGRDTAAVAGRGLAYLDLSRLGAVTDRLSLRLGAVHPGGHHLGDRRWRPGAACSSRAVRPWRRSGA